MERVARKIVRAYRQRQSNAALTKSLLSLRGVVVLCYHSIGTDLEGYAWRTTPSAFYNHLELLSEVFDIVPLDHALIRLDKAETFDRPVACLTFDDGFRDNINVATPILEKFECPAALFAPRDLIQRPTDTHLNEDELSVLARHPLWTIGAHGTTHNILPSFLQNDQGREVSECHDWLIKVTGIEPQVFAYPQGSICPTSVGQVAKLYSHALTTDRRLASRYDPLQIRRFCPTSDDDDPRKFILSLLSAPVEDGKN